MTDREYNKDNSPLQELKTRWEQYEALHSQTTALKSSINRYINFLYNSEDYTYQQIADVVGLTRERIRQIIERIQKQQEEGGAK